MKSLFPASDQTAAAHFVKIVQLIVQTLREEFLSLKEPVGDSDVSVAHLMRNGYIRCVLKGGNSIFLITKSALNLVQGNADAHSALKKLFLKVRLYNRPSHACVRMHDLQTTKALLAILVLAECEVERLGLHGAHELPRSPKLTLNKRLSNAECLISRLEAARAIV
eukprot:1740061-Pyramimonas_sp.AAC.1